MMSEATASYYAAVERRAQEAEETLRRIQLESLDAERKVRGEWDRFSAKQEAAERDHRLVENRLLTEIRDMNESYRVACAQKKRTVWTGRKSKADFDRRLPS